MNARASAKVLDTVARMRALWRHLSARRRLQFCALAALMLASALAEVVSLGAVVPFLGVLAAPETVFSYPGLAALAGWVGASGPADLTWPLTLLFAGATLVAAAIRMLLLWASTRLGFAAGADLSLEIYRRTLYQPYRVHVRRNSSEVISGIVNKVNTGVTVILSALTLASATLLMASIVIALLAIDPRVALLAAGAFGSGYALIAWATRRRLVRASRRVADEQTRIIQALQEGLGGIRDVLLDGTQQVYCDIYRRADAPLRRHLGEISVIGQSPRYLMEAFGILVVAMLAYGLSRQAGGIASAIPLLGALALGAQRLLPALQQAYYAWTGVTGNAATMDDLLALLDQPLPPAVSQPAPPAAPLRDCIEFRDVRFRYGDDGPLVLQGLNFTIARGSRVGFVGATGSGKSTVIDLMLGLLEPGHGQVLADGRPITGNHVRAWQQTVAHVPQSIFLADASITANVALGVPAEAVDMERVRQAVRLAHLEGFVDSRPEGYETRVGERGIQLSGGQRQRIGIARALYKQAKVLVFDEATSALDSATEQSIMQTIESLSRDLTVVLVAHRLSTVRHCDEIIELQDGCIAARGTYAQLLEISPSFRKLVGTE